MLTAPVGTLPVVAVSTVPVGTLAVVDTVVLI